MIAAASGQRRRNITNTVNRTVFMMVKKLKTPPGASVAANIL